jgi:heterodisulfide reductase subunit A
MTVLCPAVVPNDDAAQLAEAFAVNRDEFGFYRNEERGSGDSSVPGVLSAGACRTPGDIGSAMEQGRAAAGQILAGLCEDGLIAYEPAGIRIDAERCSGCMLCIRLCPAKAVEQDSDRAKAVIRELHCTGCGICVASCPTGAVSGGGYSSEAVTAELKAVIDPNEK